MVATVATDDKKYDDLPEAPAEDVASVQGEARAVLQDDLGHYPKTLLWVYVTCSGNAVKAYGALDMMRLEADYDDGKGFTMEQVRRFLVNPTTGHHVHRDTLKKAVLELERRQMVDIDRSGHAWRIFLVYQPLRQKGRGYINKYNLPEGLRKPDVPKPPKPWSGIRTRSASALRRTTSAHGWSRPIRVALATPTRVSLTAGSTGRWLTQVQNVYQRMVQNVYQSLRTQVQKLFRGGLTTLY